MSVRTVVVNRRREGFDVYIGRPSIWGNPYSHRAGTKALYRVGTVREAIEAYERWIHTQPQLLSLLPTLRGKALGCWCKPGPCHGDVLVKLVEELESA